MPALPLVLAWPTTTWTLIEAMTKRAAFLRRAVERLGVADRVGILAQRAEVVGRSTQWRGAFDLVTARGLGPPAVTAELGAPLLQPGGRLIVSEPPASTIDRWPAIGLAELGLGAAEPHTVHGATYAAMPRLADVGDRYPRRPGIPAKRPLFGERST